MLVLSRTKDETIRIGQDIEVRVIRLSRGRVKLGIVAPKSLHVVRGELVERGQADKDAA